jgi:flagellar motility protein MotE (MotC chaperone)
VEKRKRGEPPHWVMPGVFSGHVIIEEAVERVTSVKLPELLPFEGPASKERIEQPEEPLWKERIEQLEAQVAGLRESLAAWEERFKALDAEHKRECEYLYQVVLSLKKEWEKERDEHRHH